MAKLKNSELSAVIKKTGLKPVYLLAGEDSFLMNESLKVILASCGNDTMNTEVFYGSDGASDDVILAASTMPFLSDKRVVLVKEAHRFKKKELDKISNYCQSPSQSTVLILLWQEKVKREDKGLDVFENVTKNGDLIEFRAMYESEVSAFVRDRIKANNKIISQEAVDYIVEENGSNLQNITNEIEKLLLFADDKKQIGIDEVEMLSGHSQQYNLFNLQDALEKKDAGKSVKIVEAMLSEGEVPLIILSVVYRTFRKMLDAKSMLVEGKLMQKDVATKLRINPYFAKDFFSKLSGFTFSQLKDCLKITMQADRKLKTSSSPANLVFEEVLISALLGKSKVR